MLLKRILVPVTLAVVLLCVNACQEETVDETTKPTLFEVKFDSVSKRLQVIVHPGLSQGQTLHVRVRNGGVGYLQCPQMAASMERIDGVPAGKDNGGDSFQGPIVAETIFNNPMDERWLAPDGPAPELLLEAADAMHTIDLCLMRDGHVVRAAEMDISRALDRKGTGKFDGYGDDEERIESVVAYAKACVNQMGDIPFFERIGDGEGGWDYSTYNCLDSTPIPTEVTDADGNTTFPSEEVPVCDNPQFIYSLCEPNAVNGSTNGPRVRSWANEKGTHWVVLCRKSRIEEGAYNDIAMVGHNPFTGKTCFFQNALYSRTDGLHIPHPGDEVSSDVSPQQSTSLWSGIQGGLGSGIQCARCHDGDPMVHTPWIDGAKNAAGDPMIPKMGITDGFSEGFNDAPYSLVNLAGQGWTMPKMLVSEEAAPCTKCHRIGDGRWSNDWISRLDGKNTTWNNKVTEHGKKFEHMYWMPPEMEAIDETNWDESEFGRAIKHIQSCASSSNSLTTTLPGGTSTDDPTCKWTELPTTQIFNYGEPPTIELEGPELALEALKVLGAQVSDPNDPRCAGENGSCASRRCSECHSVSKSGLKHWRKLTQSARNSCGLKNNPDEMTQEDALKSVHCLRSRPDEPDSVFAADKVGILTTGARYGFFRKLFQKAYGEQNWVQQFVRFKARVNMPKGAYAALSQHEHAVVIKWFESNLSNLDEIIHDPPPPSECIDSLNTEFMAGHIEAMSFKGWGAYNQENGINMFGCPPGTDGLACFTDLAERQEWSTGAGKIREVVKLNFRTSFWTRSSADGRFIANGGGSQGGATVTDMVRKIDIKIKASYDPGFFPDNSGFIYQGGGTGICVQSLLETEDAIDFKEEGCIKATGINLYQHVARGLEGDYFIINSQFTSDSGSGNKDPKAHFNAGSTMKFTPMIFSEGKYEQEKAIIKDSHFEGDSVMSPSGKLVISRLAGGPEGGSLGYVLRELDMQKADSLSAQSYNINTDNVVGRFCFSGAKANISFDERFFVTHHYENGSANIVLVDLKTGQRHDVTKMPEGAKALFPHFRSDGWFYFLVRANSEEFVVASDLALILANQQ